MKKILLMIIFFAFTCMGVNAQNPWNIDGNNNVNTTHFLGTKNLNPVIFKTNDEERMRLINLKSFLGIGVQNPMASLHLHYQTDGPEFDPLRKLLQLTTDGTGNAATNGFAVFSDYTTKEILFKQQEQANFKIEGPGGGLVVAPTGKIGFGTDTPEKMVHVVGNLLIDRTADAPSSLQFRHPDTNTKGLPPNDEPQVSIAPHYWDIYSDLKGLKFNKVLKSDGTSAQIMTLTWEGRIGIGIANPLAQLHVGLNILAEGNITTKDKLILATDNTTKNRWEISRTGTGLNYTYTEKLPQDILFLGNDGKMGIGTKDPQAMLDVAGALNTSSATVKDNLGVGIDAPKQKLHVHNGNILITNTKWPVAGFEKNALIFEYLIDDGSQPWPPEDKWGIERTVMGNGNYGLNFWKYGYYNDAKNGDPTRGMKYRSIIYCSHDDNVGIGTTTPQARLDVNGSFNAQSADIAGTVTANTLSTQTATIANTLTANRMRVDNLLCAKEIKVQLTSCWPDYVFSKEHTLLPLHEVEQFITANQHLPNVPSAAEVEANGVNIGEMNAVLIQKVEELTLYILQQNKKLTDLQNQIDELKCR